MPSPLFGKAWNLQKENSLFTASFSPDTETRRYEEIPNGYRLAVTGSHQGQPYNWGYTALYDGAAHPVTGRQDIDSIIAYKVDDHVTLGIFLKNQVEGGAYSRQVPQDGRSLKVIASGLNQDGSPYFNVIKYT